MHFCALSTLQRFGDQSRWLSSCLRKVCIRIPVRCNIGIKILDDVYTLNRPMTFLQAILMAIFLQAILMAIFQGATELFPVSSLGHAVILPAVLGWNIDQQSPRFCPSSSCCT